MINNPILDSVQDDIEGRDTAVSILVKQDCCLSGCCIITNYQELIIQKMTWQNTIYQSEQYFFKRL